MSSARTPIAVVDYGVNNVGSVINGLKRVGLAPYVARSGGEIIAGHAIVLPGVGAFDTGVTNLRERGLFDAIRERVAGGSPILGICLGMQLLARGSEEGKLEGLGLVDGIARRFAFEGDARALKIPHMGWNDTRCTDARLFAGLLGDGTRFYYVHSYHVVCADRADVAATCRYGFEFTAAIGRGSVYGTQFHPEKSHRFGLRVFANFAALIDSAAAA
jgi:glutamine amidotransferase